MNKNLIPKLGLTLLILSLPFIGKAQDSYSLKSNRITVAGTSTLHDWESDVTKADWKGRFIIKDKKVIDVTDVKLIIPVKSIESDKGKIMDNKTYEAFKYEKNPDIVYQLDNATLDYQKIMATGKLSMAGVSRVISLEVSYTILSNGDIQLTGVHHMDMRDYKMDPPTAVMGTIKVGEEVTIKFDLTLTLDKTTSNAKD